MNASTKTFAILSLSAAMGNLMLKTKHEDKKIKEMINWRGEKLSESGLEAVKKYPLPTLTKSKIKQIEKKVEEVCKHNEDFNIVEKLSFLVAALVDIRSYIKPDRWTMIDNILKRTAWCIELFDSKFEQQDLYEKALIDYEKWAA